MNKTRLSLFYLAAYLLGGGAGFTFVPQTMLRLFASNRTYDDAMVRLAGLLLLGLGIFVARVIQLRAEALYSATLAVRSVILPGLITMYLMYDDPLMAVLSAIVGAGFLFTLAAYVWDRRERS